MAKAGRTLYEQALACEKAGDVQGAFAAFRESAKADPGVAAPYVGLSRILLGNHQRAQAISCLERARQCEPGNPVIHSLLGRALAQDGQLQASHQSYLQALRLDTQSLDALSGLAALLEDQGKRADAAIIYQKLLAHNPGDAEGLAGLLAVAENETLGEVIQLAKSHLENAPDQASAIIGYALGKALARQGEHDEAFFAWANANAARQRFAGPFDPQRFDQRIDQLIEIFSAEFFAQRQGWGQQNEAPVFIVGLPRSGTTLTEQILASHPDVFGAGELDLLTDLATATPDRLGRADPPWPRSALELTQHHVADIANEHLNRLSALASFPAKRIVDKQPLNFWHLGLVALTLPNARIIHCRRDIRDNGLSIFAENFNADQRWATELEDIAHYWRGYRKLMTHWRAVTPLRFIEIDYENTVNGFETQVKHLADFLELPWDANMLQFYEAKRAVQTPSRWQVRRPLYASSLGRWKHYQKFIAPLTSALNECI